MFTLYLTTSLLLPNVPISGVSVSRLLDTSSGLSYLILLSLLLFSLPCSRGGLSRSAFSSSFLTSLDVPVLPPLMDSQVLCEDGQGQEDHWSPVRMRSPGEGMCTSPRFALILLESKMGAEGRLFNIQLGNGLFPGFQLLR